MMGLFGTLLASTEDPFLFPKEGREYEPKPTPKRKPKGTLFRYQDGFSCYALNQKNADRKYMNYLKKLKQHQKP